MIFATPLALLLLLSLPVIVFLHFIRRKKRALTVPSLTIWNRVVTEHKKLFQVRRLLTNINLLLQLLCAAALALALAGPGAMRLVRNIDGNIICIIDDSASMKALENGKERFELARKKARKLAIQLDRGYEMMILGTGPRPNVITPFTGDRDLLEKKIRAMQPTDQSDHIIDTLRFAQSMRKPGDKVFLITDGAIPEISNAELRSNLHIQTVATGGNNAGITRFQFRKNMGGGEGYEILIQVRNFGTQTISGDLVIRVDKYLVRQEALSLAPDERRTLILDYDGISAGSATAELAWDDDLKTDNYAYDVFQKEQQLNILYVSPGNTFLENVLRAYPRAEIFVPDSPKDIDGEMASRYDLVVYDRIIPPLLEKGNLLLVSTLGLNLPVIGNSIADFPKITWWDEAHPLTRGLQLDDLIIRKGIHITSFGREIIPIIKSGQTPLSFIYEKKDLRVVYIGFDLLGSDFPLRTSFPLFMNKIISYLNSGYLDRPDYQIPPGEQFVVKFPMATSYLTITKPDRSEVRLPYSESGQVFLQTGQTGFYTIKGRDYNSAFAVNMTDENESDIRPRIQSDSTETGPAENNDLQTVYSPLWHIFALIALLCLAAEWLLWIRKWE
ncbi:MAG: VWA domain-containing protein [Spirochaetales bacterium]|nr:VWA domain-containing protein [Spirochaetales bacterium]